MTDPATAPGYLKEAADQLRKARNANEVRASTVTSWLSEGAVPVFAEVNDRRMEIAREFRLIYEAETARLAATRPEPGQEAP